jgi:probable HAF family extracellular repeat protein
MNLKTRTHALGAALLAAALLAHSLPANAQGRASLVGLGTLGGVHSFAYAISASGQVTGYSADSSGSNHAFRYSGGSMQDLGTLGGNTSLGEGINASGQVTGYAYLSGDSAYHAFLYSGGTMQDLGTLGGTSSSGIGINASGQVAGYSQLAGTSAQRAFLYSGGRMQDLGTLGGANSRGLGINANGQVTGGSDVAGNSAEHAFLYSGGSMQDLGTLGGTNSAGRAINASGQVTGYAYLSGNSAFHAFLYSGGSMQDLGTFGGTRSFGEGINASGQVTGYAYLAGDSVYRAFLYSAGRMSDLNAVAPAGWLLLSAEAINDNAQITGIGIHSGRTEAYVLTLHPDWQGGNGAWGDGNHWAYGGFGVMAMTPGAIHDVVINPAGSATVLGGADVTVSSLRIAGKSGEIVTLNLNGGGTTSIGGTVLEANAALAGSGRLGGGLEIRAGGRVNIGAGESMQLTGGKEVRNSGTIRALGTAASPASLEIGVVATNNAGAQINLQNANVSFLGGLRNSGQVNTTFGVSNIAGNIDNLRGNIIVSNGASASFFGALVNNGELRVSAGGAANFFGLVSGAGSFTGTGAARFEGGFSPGGSPALVTVEYVTTYGSGSEILMELGGTTPGSGHDKIVFTNGVTLESGALNVVWYGAWTGSQGDLYDLFDWNGGVDGTFGDVNLPTLSGGLLWNMANLYTSGDIGIYAPVPEPGTYAMMLAGLSLLGFIARRRKKARLT